MMTVKGIDVSKYQGNVDFNKVKAAGYDFVILNAGYGRYLNQKDPYFDSNYEKAQAAGLGIGAYWYSYAVNEAQAKEEARVFLEAVGDRRFSYPLCFDIEDKTQSGLSQAVIGKMINAFCGYLEEKGYYAAIYSYADFLKNKVPVACRSRYDVWVAHFGVSKPSYPYAYGMWQYSSAGKVSGISGDCDLDYAYKDYPAIMKSKGLNGYEKAGSKVLDESGFREGDKSLGVLAMKELLILARERGLIGGNFEEHETFGSGTKKAVNALLKAWGYKENGIAGEKFIVRLRKEISPLEVRS